MNYNVNIYQNCTRTTVRDTTVKVSAKTAEMLNKIQDLFEDQDEFMRVPSREKIVAKAVKDLLTKMESKL